MFILYSEEVKKLMDKIRPYIDFTKLPPELKPETPKSIRADAERVRKLLKKEFEDKF